MSEWAHRIVEGYQLVCRHQHVVVEQHRLVRRRALPRGEHTNKQTNKQDRHYEQGRYIDNTQKINISLNHPRLAKTYRLAKHQHKRHIGHRLYRGGEVHVHAHSRRHLGGDGIGEIFLLVRTSYEFKI